MTNVSDECHYLVRFSRCSITVYFAKLQTAGFTGGNEASLGKGKSRTSAQLVARRPEAMTRPGGLCRKLPGSGMACSVRLLVTVEEVIGQGLHAHGVGMGRHAVGAKVNDQSDLRSQRRPRGLRTLCRWQNTHVASQSVLRVDRTLGMFFFFIIGEAADSGGLT